MVANLSKKFTEGLSKIFFEDDDGNQTQKKQII